KADENGVWVTQADGKRWRATLDPPFPDPTWPGDFRGSFYEMLDNFLAATRGRPSEIADVTDAEAVTRLISWAYSRRNETFSSNRGAKAADDRRVLVTGATGFIGGHLIERLSLGDTAIRVTARSPGSCANVARYPVEIAPTDLLDKKQVRAAMAGVRTVY